MLVFFLEYAVLIATEGQFTRANSVRDFPSNKRISGDFHIKQWDFHKRCTRFSQKVYEIFLE